ncbi:MAG: FkbM family methyltransferase, partial [Prosthecobacter sp.]|nr:FkbM family methyltransferase [Prosthecobacter sp.]
TLDAYVKRAPKLNPLLLKLDIEGYAAAALRGAENLLQEVPWVVVETHHPEELVQSATILTQHGFGLRHFHGRTMWWARQR